MVKSIEIISETNHQEIKKKTFFKKCNKLPIKIYKTEICIFLFHSLTDLNK